jgi:RHS repeat-associated protein
MFAGTTSLTAANGYVVRAGDLLTWRQYQDGSAVGGLFFGLLNSSGNYVDGTSLRDTDNQPILADATKNSWHVRTVDLSSFAGMKIDLIDPFDSTNAPAGAWDIYYGDITLVSTDGTFIPIYSRSMMTLSPATAPGVSGFSVITEKVADTSPLTTTTYYHGDQIGSTRLLTAGAGWPIASSIYYPYGEGPTSGTNHYLFTGKERDAESGNDYFGARYYASSMGRFMSPDFTGDDDGPPGPVPYADLSDPQSLNLYAYVQNNPLNRFDSEGHDCVNASGASSGYILVQSTQNAANCASGFTYVNGTVTPGSGTYNAETGTLSYSISNYADGSGMAATVVNSEPASFNDSLMYNAFGPPSASTWNNSAGTTNAVGKAWFNVVFPWESLATDLLSGSGSNGAQAAGISRKPGTLGMRKGTDALRREDKIARDIAKKLGLSEEEAEMVHGLLQEGSQDEGRALTYREALEYVAKALGKAL